MNNFRTKSKITSSIEAKNIAVEDMRNSNTKVSYLERERLILRMPTNNQLIVRFQ